MRIETLNQMYQGIVDVFSGDKRPLDLAGIFPMKLEDLKVLLTYSDLIDVNGNLHINATQEKFVFILSMYYSLKPQARFTRPKPASYLATGPA